jgi:hypothetical protein
MLPRLTPWAMLGNSAQSGVNAMAYVSPNFKTKKALKEAGNIQQRSWVIYMWDDARGWFAFAGRKYNSLSDAKRDYNAQTEHKGKRLVEQTVLMEAFP